MKDRFNFTKRAIEDLPAPKEKRCVYLPMATPVDVAAGRSDPVLSVEV
jgi:hypothetical protein